MTPFPVSPLELQMARKTIRLLGLALCLISAFGAVESLPFGSFQIAMAAASSLGCAKTAPASLRA
jgi:hypothetical protein